MKSVLPLVQVFARIVDQQGKPVHRAIVTMKLTTTERYGGYVVPRETRVETGPDGKAVLHVWPNELGTEASEYHVIIEFPEKCGVPVRFGSCVNSHPERLPPLRTIHGHATVPNADCNLSDIMELPPYEQRGAGQVIPSEVAGWAAAAGEYADAARDAVSAAQAVETRLNATADASESAKEAAIEAAKQAQAHEKHARELVDKADGAICHFTHSVIGEVEKTAKRLTTESTICITQHKACAIEAIELRSGEALTEITETATAMKTDSVRAVKDAECAALSEIDASGKVVMDMMRDEAAIFGKDFENLAERAQTSAKRACCSSASAANSASKACACAEKACAAAQGLERYRDDALTAAERAETSAQCSRADAQRAEAAAISSQKNANYATGSALAAQKNAQAAEASADLASQSAETAVAAQQAVAKDHKYIEHVAGDVKQAVSDVATDMLTEQVVTDAVQHATDESLRHAEEANRYATEAGDSAHKSLIEARNAAKRADRAAEAAQKAEEFASKLENEFHAHQALAGMQTELIRLSDRSVKYELALLHGGLDSARMKTEFERLTDRVTVLELAQTTTGVIMPSHPPDATVLPPEGVQLSAGVKVAPVTIVTEGFKPPDGAAIQARISEYTSI